MRRLCALTFLLCLPVSAAEPPTLDQALDHLYNFQFPPAHEVLNRLVERNPKDPLPYAFRASAYLFFELDRMGTLESEFLIDDQKIIEKKKPVDPDAKVRNLFMQALGEAQNRAEAALAANPKDRDALFAMCIAQGVATDYMALVEKKQIASLAPAKKSNQYAQRLLAIDPKFYDAYLTAGFSEYMVGSLPFFIRWFVHFDNVNGNKARGVQSLELAAREGHYFRALAKILIGIIALREKRPLDAQKLLIELAHDYPLNPLFHKELAKINSKLGIAAN